MPDHLHLLIQLGDGAGLSAAVRRIKAVTARVANCVDQRSGPVWMPGFHDRAVRAEDDLAAVARYVVRNPVRAGLSNTSGAYPYWDAVWIGAGDTGY